MNKQELIKEYESIVKDDSLDLCGCYNMGDKIFMRKIYKSVLEDLEQLDEPQKIKLKDVIARIQKLDLGTQKVWLSEILNELGSDYGTLKYKDGYEQGKFDCAMEREKVTIPQFVADWIETCKENNIISLSGAFEYAKEEVDTWLSDWKNQEIFASAWIFGYKVEKEKRYYVRFKWIEESYSYLTLIKHLNTWTLSSIKLDKKFRKEHTKKQLEEAGFGWVFDCEGIELEEVKE